MKVRTFFAWAALAVAQDAEIRVRLVSGAGRPGPYRAGYDVWAVRAGCRESYRAATAAGGTATLTVPPGGYSIYASGGDIGVKPVQMSVKAGADLYLELTALAEAEDTGGRPLFRPWRLVILDQERKPVEGARIEMVMRGRRNPSGFWLEYSTDAVGEVNLCRVRGEVAEITVSCEGCDKTKRVVRYEEGSGPVEIRVKRPAPK